MNNSRILDLLQKLKRFFQRLFRGKPKLATTPQPITEPVKPNPMSITTDQRLGMVEKSVEIVFNTFSEKITILDNIGKTVAALDSFVKKTIQDSNLPREVKEAVSFVWEYVLLYMVILFSVGAGFGWISFTAWDPTNLSKLAFVLVGCILIGFIKTQYQNYLQSKEKNISSLKAENDSLKTALNTNAFMTGNAQAELKALKDFCHQRIQNFDTEFAWNPRYTQPNL